MVGRDERRSREQRLHNAALHTNAAAVNDPHRLQSERPCLFEISFHNCGGFAWMHGVQIEAVTDRYADWLAGIHTDHLQRTTESGQLTTGNHLIYYVMWHLRRNCGKLTPVRIFAEMRCMELP
jgi:hypothetical protein